MRRFRTKYNFDSVNYDKKVITAIANSCITNTKTIEILIKNSIHFNPMNYRLVELTGLAKFEFAEKIPSLTEMFQSLRD